MLKGTRMRTKQSPEFRNLKTKTRKSPSPHTFSKNPVHFIRATQKTALASQQCPQGAKQLIHHTTISPAEISLRNHTIKYPHTNTISTPSRGPFHTTTRLRSHHLENLSDDFLDDDLFDLSPSPPAHSPLYHQNTQKPLAANETAPNYPTNSHETHSNNKSSEIPDNSHETIFSVISGIHQSPVGVTAIRISGPNAYQLLSIITRTPYDSLMKSAQSRIFTRPLYSIPISHYKPYNILHNNLISLSDQYGQEQLQKTGDAQSQNSAELVDAYFSQQDDLSSIRDLQKFKQIPHPPRENNDMIDLEAMVLSFFAPKSFTGEHCVELHVHGNPIIVRELLSNLAKIKSARLARPGEFIQRAYLNNRLSLLQVESYYNLINVTNAQQLLQTTKSHRFNQDIEHIYARWRNLLVESLAYLESIIDFGDVEGDVDDKAIMQYVYPSVFNIQQDIYNILQTNKSKEKVYNGLSIAIFGEPNAGKSSLMNTIIGKQLAIVSAIPGTTRDIVTTTVELDGDSGLTVQLHDTAGLRDNTNDVVEWEGIRRAKELSEKVDYKIVLIDSNAITADLNDKIILPHHTKIHSVNDLIQHPLYKQTILDSIFQNAGSSNNGLLIQNGKNTINSLLDARSLLLLTKCDTLPFTEFVVDNSNLTSSKQPTSDPLYLNEQTIQRASLEDENNMYIASTLDQLQTILAGNQGNGVNINNDSVNRRELFNDLYKQITHNRTLSNNISDRNNNAVDTDADGCLIKGIKSIPLAESIQHIINEYCNENNEKRGEKKRKINNVLCISSKYNYNINKITTSIQNYTNDLIKQQHDLLLQQFNFNGGVTPQKHDSTFFSQHQNKSTTLSNLFLKEDITLTARHRQSLINCYTFLEMFTNHFATLASAEHNDHTKLSATNHIKNNITAEVRTILPRRDKDLVMCTEYLRKAVGTIAEIDGKGQVDAEEVLDTVFNRFCIGK